LLDQGQGQSVRDLPAAAGRQYQLEIGDHDRFTRETTTKHTEHRSGKS
jgi:hypothetical protein